MPGWPTPHLARAHKRWIMLGLAMIPLVAAMSTLRPLLLKHAVDQSIPAGDGVELILGHGLAVVEQPADQCGLAVVDAAGGGDAQQPGHQK